MQYSSIIRLWWRSGCRTVRDKQNVAVIDPLAQHDIDRQGELVLDITVGILFCHDEYRMIRFEPFFQFLGTPCHIHKTFSINPVNRLGKPIHFKFLAGSQVLSDLEAKRLGRLEFVLL